MNSTITTNIAAISNPLINQTMYSIIKSIANSLIHSFSNLTIKYDYEFNNKQCINEANYQLDYEFNHYNKYCCN